MDAPQAGVDEPTLTILEAGGPDAGGQGVGSTGRSGAGGFGTPAGDVVGGRSGGFVADPPGEDPEAVLAEPPNTDDIAAELSAPPRRKLPWLTLLLAAGVVAAGAFVGGVEVQKHQGGGGANAFASALRSGTAGRSGATAGATGGGFGGFGGGGFGGGSRTGAGAGAGTGAAGGAGGAGAAGGGTTTTGTVKLVDGTTIYVTDSSGNIVKVTTNGSTKVNLAKTGKVSDIKAGQTVTVSGTPDSSGDVAAGSVTEGGSTAAK